MVSLELLSKICIQLNRAKNQEEDSDTVFGNIGVLMAGDFKQFALLAQTVHRFTKAQKQKTSLFEKVMVPKSWRFKTQTWAQNALITSCVGDTLEAIRNCASTTKQMRQQPSEGGQNLLRILQHLRKSMTDKKDFVQLIERAFAPESPRPNAHSRIAGRGAHMSQ